MGRYFGIRNITKNHSVCSGNRCWKANGWCDLYGVMHQFRWDKEDKIYLAAYDTCHIFEYVKGEMKIIDITDDDILFEKFFGNKGLCVDNDTRSSFWLDDLELSQTEDHIPIWDENNCCSICKYQYAEKETPQFDEIFFMG